MMIGTGVLANRGGARNGCTRRSTERDGAIDPCTGLDRAGDGREGRVSAGRLASVRYAAVLRAGDFQIVAGAECNIQGHCCRHVDPGEPVVLAERLSSGHGCVVHGAHVQEGALI
jgi:hypothetical protein